MYYLKLLWSSNLDPTQCQHTVFMCFIFIYLFSVINNSLLSRFMKHPRSVNIIIYKLWRICLTLNNVFLTVDYFIITNSYGIWVLMYSRRKWLMHQGFKSISESTQRNEYLVSSVGKVKSGLYIVLATLSCLSFIQLEQYSMT